ncbi:hypothetical protein HLB44_27935 [Aquincola sp. S2]|uniref:Uncharacterized protein n=1 Tax=Pseudaquabacterium terrae TaxID=2732868 RepID=A0ABX2EQQ0_9BURK|nr:hypothetical protein [Aquabacterium terrae]
MTLQQLSTVKRWHQTHHKRGLEYQLWDAMLTCWILGWMGLPAALLLAPEIGVLLCPVLYFAPSLYVRLRLRLHRRGVLRCDWLDSARMV